MKINKYLLTLQNKSLIRNTIDNLLDAELNDIYLILGENSSIQSEVKDYKIHILVNNLKISEMADSIKIALNNINASNEDGILITPADIPLVKIDTIKHIVKSFIENKDKIIIPIYKGRKGHPVIFPSKIIYDLFNENTLRDILKKHEYAIFYCKVNDEGILLDIDSIEDYERVKHLLSNKTT